MADVNFSITNPLEGQEWNGVLILPGPTNVLIAQNGIDEIILNTPFVTFNPNSFYFSNTEYLSWRTQPSNQKYPDSGYSIDIWSFDFWNDAVNNSFTWNQAAAHGPYDLFDNKWSLLYFYNGPTAFGWSRGGQITFTL